MFAWESLHAHLAACSGIGADALILVPGTKGDKDKQDASTAAGDEAAPQLSKSQLRKLKQIQQKKERRENLSQVLTVLEGSRVSDDALAVMRPLHQRGARETKRQRLRRALRLERAGVALDAATAEELHPSGRPRKRRGGAASSDEGESEEGSVSEEEEEEQVQRPGQANTVQGGARVAGGRNDGKSDSDESDSEEEEGGEAGQAAAQGAAAKAPPASQPPAKKAKQAGAALQVPATDPAAAKLAEDKRVREEVRRARQEAGVDVEADGSDGEGGGGHGMRAAQPAVPSSTPAGGRHRVVTVTRPPAIEEARQGLPIIGMEQVGCLPAVLPWIASDVLG